MADVSTTGTSYSVTDYGVFEEAITTTNNLIGLLEKNSELLINKKTSVSEDEFAGPVADSFYADTEMLGQYLLKLKEKYENIVTSLQTFSVNYEEADKAASEEVTESV